MPPKLYRRAIGLSVATLIAGTVLPAMAHAMPTASVQDSATSGNSDEVSPNPAHDPQFVLANLTEVSPFNLIYVISDEWGKGNRLRASLWYYIWQIRTDAWVEGVDDPAFQITRNMINDQMGQSINTWIAADPAAWRDTAERAIAYETKLPMSKMRPENRTEAEWEAIVQKTRADYARDFREAFAQMSPDDIRAARLQNGLPVGPLTDAGAPLPDDWR